MSGPLASAIIDWADAPHHDKCWSNPEHGDCAIRTALSLPGLPAAQSNAFVEALLRHATRDRCDAAHLDDCAQVRSARRLLEESRWTST